LAGLRVPQVQDAPFFGTSWLQTVSEENAKSLIIDKAFEVEVTRQFQDGIARSYHQIIKEIN